MRTDSCRIVLTCFLLAAPATGQDVERGDANADGFRDISDAIYVLKYLFAGGEEPGCLAQANVDGSGTIDLTDAVYLLRFLFVGGSPPEPLTEEEAAACGLIEEFVLVTSAFEDLGVIPSQYTCEGEDISPPFDWTGAPAETLSFAITCIDIDSTFGTWIHWIAWDISGEDTALPEGAPPPVEGTNSWRRTDYGGPCPRVGSGYHRYVFALYALDLETLSLPSSAGLDDLEAAVQGHILGTAAVTGKYRRD